MQHGGIAGAHHVPIESRWVALFALAACGAGHGALDIASSTQLFVDDFLVAQRVNVTRTMHSPEASFRVAIRPDAAWEKGYAIGVIGTSVVHVDDQGTDAAHAPTGTQAQAQAPTQATSQAPTLRVYYTLRNATLGCGCGDQPPCSGHYPPQPNFEPSAGPMLTAVAESSDLGVTWTKPLLHRYSIGGSTANNILGEIFQHSTEAYIKRIKGYAATTTKGTGNNGTKATARATVRPNTTHIDTVFVDPTVTEGSPRRYRGVSDNIPFWSADGLNWTMSPVPWAMDATPLYIGDWGSGGFDTKPAVFWDPPCNCFSFYTRFKNNVPPRPNTTQQMRMVRRGRSFSLDSNGGKGNWVNQSVVMRADAIDNHSHISWDADHIPAMDYYGATPWHVDTRATGATPHHGSAPPSSSLYFMAAVRFWHWGPAQAHEPGGSHNGPGTYDLALAFSRDGVTFEFLGDRRAWVGPGREGSVGSRRMWLAAPGAVQAGDDDLFFVTRTNAAEGTSLALDPLAIKWDSDIAIGRLRRHGLVSLDAPYSRWVEAATVTTKPLIFQGRRLVLNLNSAGGGALTVQLRLAGDGQARPPRLQSVPLVTNSVRATVLWNGDATTPGNATAVAAFSGVPVVLTIRMQACQLYTLQFQ